MSDASDITRTGTNKVLRWLLGGQIALAALLIAVDFAPTIPRLLTPSDAPQMDRPTQPGDQTRQYQPRRLTNPVPGMDRDMPRRLVTERVQRDGQDALQIRGMIAPGDGARIMGEIRQGQSALVVIDSPGGSVADALAIGAVLREVGTETRVEDGAVCLSACPYMFVGGAARRVSEDARLGVHQHSFGESTILPAFLAVADIQRGQAGVLRHLDEMGIDLRIMGPAMATPANEIYILTRDELQDWNVISE